MNGLDLDQAYSPDVGRLAVHKGIERLTEVELTAGYLPTGRNHTDSHEDERNNRMTDQYLHLA